MKEMKEGTHFERTLPEGYRAVLTVDAKENKKTVGLLNLGAIVIMAAVVAVAYLIIRPEDFSKNSSWLRTGLTVGTIFVYIILHELVHGAAYKILTGERLTFGMTLSVAFCGVPHIYVYRRAAMVALLAPFAVFTVVFGAGFLVFGDPWDRMSVAFVLAMHLGGCVGDLYNTVLYLVRLRDPETLMQDTGPKQTFYQK